MNKTLLLLLVSLPLVTGCVSYYYPETAMVDGVYYAQDDPAYSNNAYVNSYSYATSAYYPWWSMDYFYLGYGPRLGYGYGHYGYGGWAIGASWGYSPWPSPYYSHYVPWYVPYPYYPGRYAYTDHCQSYYGCGGSHGAYRSGNHDRYAGDGRAGHRDRGDEDESHDTGQVGRSSHRVGGSVAAPVRRYVSTAPSGYASDQGMVIRNRETAKAGRSRVEPVSRDPLETTALTFSPARIATPDYRTRFSGGDMRYRSDSKPGHSQTGPVHNRRQATGVAAISTSAQSNYRTRMGGGSGEVRGRSAAKQGKSHAAPVYARPVVSGATPVASSQPPVRSGTHTPATYGKRSQGFSGGSGRRSSGPGGSGSRSTTPRHSVRSSGGSGQHR